LCDLSCCNNSDCDLSCCNKNPCDHSCCNNTRSTDTGSRLKCLDVVNQFGPLFNVKSAVP
jgi:hypothetical protein